MWPIKEFLEDCYGDLTSREEITHRPQATKTRRRSRGAATSRSVALSRRFCQEPDQQSEQDQSSQNRKQRVQRMKLKQRIPLKSMPCRQHETSFGRAPRWQQTALSHYFPTFTRGIPAFRQSLGYTGEFQQSHRAQLPCDTPLPCPKKLPSSPERRAASDFSHPSRWRKPDSAS